MKWIFVIESALRLRWRPVLFAVPFVSILVQLSACAPAVPMHSDYPRVDCSDLDYPESSYMLNYNAYLCIRRNDAYLEDLYDHALEFGSMKYDSVMKMYLCSNKQGRIEEISVLESGDIPGDLLQKIIDHVQLIELPRLREPQCFTIPFHFKKRLIY